MSFQQQLTNVTNLRQQALTQQNQQRQAIVAQWKPIVHELLQILGETVWGKDRYSVIEPIQSATWTLVNIKGTKNSQFFVILDFDFIDIDAILAKGDALPTQLVTATGFRVIGKNEFKAGVSQAELERALSVAHQQGANQEQLPPEIKKAMERLPYQVDEHDQRGTWKNIIMSMAGPVTVLMAIGGIIASPISIIGGISSCSNSHYPPAYCGSIGATLLQLIIPFVLLAIVSVPFLFGGFWVTKLTNSGKRYNKLPPKQKNLATLAMLPGMAMTAYMSLAFVIVIVGFIIWAGVEAQQSSVRRAVHNEFREHGL